MTAQDRRFPLIASHRGGAGLWPENSRTAFENTAKLPVELVEFDVQRSRDGVLVVFHDATLDRVTDGTGPLADKTWAELRRLTYRGSAGDRLLTLEETAALFRPTAIDLRLEIKPGVDLVPYTGIEAEIAAVLDAQGMLARTQITSFRRTTLSAFRHVARPGRGLLWLIADAVLLLVDDDPALCALCRAAGADQMAVAVNRLSAARVAAAAEHGVALSSFATHTEAEIAHAARCGVPVFTTDYPDRALAIRAQWRASATGDHPAGS